jgi:hypothetical protein
MTGVITCGRVSGSVHSYSSELVGKSPNIQKGTSIAQDRNGAPFVCSGHTKIIHGVPNLALGGALIFGTHRLRPSINFHC